MNAQSGIASNFAAEPKESPEVYARLHRAEACAEQLSMLVSQLNERLTPVTRAQAPEAGTAIKQVGYSVPLAAQIDSLADRLSSSMSVVESILSRLEV